MTDTRHTDLFEPRQSARPAASRGLSRIQHWHPVVAVLAVVSAGFVILTAAFTGIGLLITHLMSHSQLGRSDNQLSVWFAGHRSHLWNTVSLDLTRVGDVPGIAIVALAVTILLVIRKWGRVATLLAIGLALELAVFELTEHLVRRPRPDIPHLGLTPPTFSWPSGHTAATVVLYGGIALLVTAATRRLDLRIVAWSVAVLLSIGMAGTRVYEGEHHLSDVIGGALLGIACLYFAVLAVRAGGRRTSHRTLAQGRTTTGADTAQLSRAP